MRDLMHHLATQYKKCSGWGEWWDRLLDDGAVTFLRRERNYLLKEGPMKIHQVVHVGRRTCLADEHYYFETADVPAPATIQCHLTRIHELVHDADRRFGNSLAGELATWPPAGSCHGRTLKGTLSFRVSS